jgi:hypothetical protein
MPLNTNLLRAPAAIEFPDQVNRLAQFSQIQNAQNQNALAQYQLSAAQRAEEQQNALYQRARTPNFKLDFNTALEFGPTGIAAYKAQQEAAKQVLEADKLRGEIAAQPLARAKTKAETDAAELKRRSDIVENISGAFVPLAAASAQGTPVSLAQVQSAAQSLLRRGLIGQTEIDELPQSDADVPEFLKNLVFGSDKARKALVDAMPKIERVDTGSNITPIQGNPLLPRYGQTMTNVPVIPKTAAPAGPSPLSVLQAEVAALPVGDPRRVELEKKIAKETESPRHYVSSEQGVMAVDPTGKVTPVLVNGKPLLDTSTTQGRKQLDIANARLKISQDTERRLQEEADSSGGLSPQALDIAAQMVLQSGVMPPLGSGKKASEARVQVMNRVAELGGTNAAASAESILTNRAAQLGRNAAERTIGTTSANIQIASNEAKEMIGIVKEIVPKVNLTNYPSLNAIENAVSKGTGGVEIVQLNTALNALVNTYARAINPKGTPTISDKNHARDIINSALSKKQINGALDIMDKEMAASLASPGKVREALRTPTNAPSATPAAAPSAARGSGVDTSNPLLRD